MWINNFMPLQRSCFSNLLMLTKKKVSQANTLHNYLLALLNHKKK